MRPGIALRPDYDAAQLRALVSVRKPAIEIIGFLSRRKLHLERSPSGTRHCSQPENADFLSEMFPDRH
jgi:hypothetical protein